MHNPDIRLGRLDKPQTVFGIIAGKLAEIRIGKLPNESLEFYLNVNIFGV
jgi:hypothetical protein